MSLKPFTYPFPETRFLHAGPNVYKFKIRYGNSIRGEEIDNKEAIIRELEDSIRAVLGNLDNLQPFVTEHFIVFPYKSKWERVSHLKFKHGEIILIPYPFVFTLYVEMKWFHENLSPGKSINDSPLDLLLTEKKTARASMRKRGLVEEPSSPSRTGLHRAKMGTSSQESSKKKPHVETRKNKERKPQQECQATLDSDPTDAQEQDVSVNTGALTGALLDPGTHMKVVTFQLADVSPWTVVILEAGHKANSKKEHSLPGPVVPPLQQNNPPPPKEQDTSGFFGFLSAVFPFRYFFRKNSQ